MFYVYAIIPSPYRLPHNARGFDEEPLSAMPVGNVAIAYSRLGGAGRGLEANPETALLHEQVVERLHALGPVLPMRFGTRFPDAQAMHGAIAAHEQAFVNGLQKVAGQVEMGIRALSADGAPSADAPDAEMDSADAGAGRRYMLNRLACERRKEESSGCLQVVMKRLHETVAARCTDSTYRLESLQDGQAMLSGAYLVPRSQMELMARRVRRIAKRMPTLRVLCTGPWPPYHFVPQIGQVRSESRTESIHG